MDERLQTVGVAAILRQGALRARSEPDGAPRSSDDWRPAAIASAVAAVLALGYLLAPLTGQDTSAQLARADFAYAHPVTPVDLRWFGGTLQFGYSLWAPWLAGLIGVRLLGAVMVVAGTWLATRLMQQAAPARPLWGGVAAAFCQVANVAMGRITYQCALVFALAAALAVLFDRRALALFAAILAGAASPVATLGLWVYALTGLARRRVAEGVILAGGSTAGTAVVSIVFADGATMGFPRESLIRAVLASLLVIALLPRRHNLIRLGAAVNLAVVIVCAIVSSPVGSNAERLGQLFAIPVVAAFAEWRAPVAAAAVIVAVVAQPPVTLDIVRLAGVPATHDAYYRPLVTAINDLGPLSGRVEVPEMNGHWDAALLAEHVPVARGWLRQLDTKLNKDVFFDHAPTAASYRSWLDSNAVQYVAVPDARLTVWGRREKALVQAGLPYLHEVWHDRHWTLYAVSAATQIVSKPGKLVSMDAARIVLTAPPNSSVLVRIRWFRWTTLDPSSVGCIVRAGDHVILRTGKGHTPRYVISSSARPRETAAERGHCA